MEEVEEEEFSAVEGRNKKKKRGDKGGGGACIMVKIALISSPAPQMKWTSCRLNKHSLATLLTLLNITEDGWRLAHAAGCLV